MTDMNHPAESLTDDATFAMCRLIERLMNEGYIYTERVPELSERIQSMERGDGFLTKAELRARTTTTKATTAEDLLS